MTTPTNDTPRIASDWCHVGGKGGYELTEAQKTRRARKQSIYKRDKQVAPYEVSKGKFV